MPIPLLTGTPVTVANFSIINGWGFGGAITSATGTQTRCFVVITAGTSPTINPRFSFSYPDGPFPVEPGIIAKQVDGTGQFADLSYSTDVAVTIFTYMEFPVAGKTYSFMLSTLGI